MDKQVIIESTIEDIIYENMHANNEEVSIKLKMIEAYLDQGGDDYDGIIDSLDRLYNLLDD